VPRTAEAVAGLARFLFERGLIGVDPTGVRFELVTDAGSLADLDARGSSAVALADGGQRFVYLSPAAFDDVATLSTAVGEALVRAAGLAPGVAPDEA
jgi:hypothetical protein